MDNLKFKQLIKMISTLSEEEMLDIKSRSGIDITRIIVKNYYYDGSEFFSVKYLGISSECEEYETFTITGSTHVGLLESAQELDIKIRDFFIGIITRGCKDFGLPLSTDPFFKRITRAVIEVFIKTPPSPPPAPLQEVANLDPIERHLRLLQEIGEFPEYKAQYHQFIDDARLILSKINDDMKYTKERYFITDQSYNIIYNNIKSYSVYTEASDVVETIEDSMLRQISMLNERLHTIIEQYNHEQSQRILESVVAQEEMIKTILRG